MLSVARGLIHREHQVTLVCQPASRLAARARECGIIPFTLRLRGDFDPLVMARLYWLIRRRRIQMVCANMDKEVRLAGLAAKLAGVPLIRRRGSDMPFPNKLRFRLVNRHLVRLIIVNSRATRNTLLQKNPWICSRKLRLIYNGIPTSPEGGAGKRGEVLGEFGLKGAWPVLAIIGLLKERKGHEILFRALPEVKMEFPRLALLVVGEGELRGNLEELACRLGIAENVRFVGFRNDIPRLMSSMDFLVLPSKNEGFGYVLAEAMSQGKPVVASKVSSIPEVVEDGHTGLLVPPGDVSALREAILELSRHPRRVRQMGEAGRRRVQKLFDLQRMLGQVEALFGQVVGEVSVSGDF
ncbi:glycosyltransferase family 4 protein [bacterium]|nr:glycosyltransferase family 4 protein [bacterium]